MAPSNRTLVLLLGVLVAVVFGWLLKVGAPILQPLVIALLLAGMLQPVLRVLMRIGIPPVLSALLILAVLAYGLFQGALVIQSNVRAFLGAQDRQVRAAAPAEPGGATGGSESGTPIEGLGGDGGGDGSAEGEAPPVDEAAGPAADAGLDGGAAEPLGPVDDPTQDPVPPAGDAPTEAAIQGEPGEGESFDPISSSNQEVTAGFGGWDAIVDRVESRLGELSLPKELTRPLIRELRGLSDQRDTLALDLVLGGGQLLRSVALVLLYMLFIFAEQAVFRRKILSIAGDRREQAQETLDTIGRGIQRFLGLKTLLSFATGALCYAALVALEIPYALLFGILTFGLNYIPYFGSIAAGILPALTAFAIGASWTTIAIIGAVYLAVNMIIGNIVEPRIMGRELDLSPLVILVSVVVWVSLWGVVGAFLAVPLTATLQIILAGSDTTRPIAIMLSSGPPRGPGRGLRRA